MVSGEWAIKAHSVNSEDFKYILGRYETKERAREVLQEIISTYKFNRCEAVGQKNKVYEMPEN